MSKTQLRINDTDVTLEAVARKPGEVRFTLNGKQYRFRSRRLPDGSFLLEEEIAEGAWVRLHGGAWASGKNMRRVQLAGLEARVSDAAAGAADAAAGGALSPLAPMPGLVRQLLVKKGDTVKQGQALAVLEAMKLQLTLSAGGDGIVDSVLVKEGQMVAEGTELVKLAPPKKK